MLYCFDIQVKFILNISSNAIDNTTILKILVFISKIITYKIIFYNFMKLSV